MSVVIFRRLRRALPAVLAAALVCGAGGASAQHDHGTAHVHFPVSCSAEAQAAFDQGMLMQHSFWHDAATAAFEKALRLDPHCAMADWGIALASLNNPLNAPAPGGYAEAQARLAAARAIGLATPREAEYVAALDELVQGPDERPWATRTAAFAAAMERLAAHHADDPEAAILYALALVMAAPPDDATFANQRRAAAILEPLFKLQPDHPGIAHYLIHAYDTPPDAPKGLPAARSYAAMAGEVPHALHMPSHIFTRTGAWQESIDTNLRSVDAARAAGEPNDELHARDYLVYAYLQTGRTKAAQAVRQDAAAAAGHLDPTHVGGPFAVAAIDARLALETGDWNKAASLPVRPVAAGFEYVPAMTHYARAIGLARAGRPAAAAADLAELARLAGVLYGADRTYWAEQVEIELVSAGAWVAFAGGRRESGLAQMRAAAELERVTSKNVVTPGPLAPARELLGEMLLEAGDPAAARREFAATLETEPERFRSVYGEAYAAELAGDRPGAAAGYAHLLKIAAAGDPDRPELKHARDFLAGAR